MSEVSRPGLAGSRSRAGNPSQLRKASTLAGPTWAKITSAPISARRFRRNLSPGHRRGDSSL